MADGTYERRGPREAELKHLQRLIDEQRGKTTPKPDGQSASHQDKLKSARVVS